MEIRYIPRDLSAVLANSAAKNRLHQLSDCLTCIFLPEDVVAMQIRPAYVRVLEGGKVRDQYLEILLDKNPSWKISGSLVSQTSTQLCTCI